MPFTWYKFAILRKCVLIFLLDYLSMRSEAYSRILWNPLCFVPFQKPFFQIHSVPCHYQIHNPNISAPSHLILPKNVALHWGERGMCMSLVTLESSSCIIISLSFSTPPPLPPPPPLLNASVCEVRVVAPSFWLRASFQIISVDKFIVLSTYLNHCLCFPKQWWII